MAEQAPHRRPRPRSEILRAQIRSRAAYLLLTHAEIGRRLTDLG